MEARRAVLSAEDRIVSLGVRGAGVTRVSLVNPRRVGSEKVALHQGYGPKPSRSLYTVRVRESQSETELYD